MTESRGKLRAPPLYCYGPQVRAATILMQDYLRNGSATIIPVDQPQQLAGLEDVRFVEVCGHPVQVPTDIYTALRLYGAIVWRIDDSMRRACCQRRERCCR